MNAINVNIYLFNYYYYQKKYIYLYNLSNLERSKYGLKINLINIIGNRKQ
jgi:hypothetical protein